MALKIKRIEKLACSQPELQVRIALMGAVCFAVERKAEFERCYGTYGVKGLERLMNEEVNPEAD